MSLDGYVAGPNQSLKNPLGEGGEKLHDWAFAARSFRSLHGMEGGTTGVDDEVVSAAFQNIGATIMGRNMFGPVRGPWVDDWKGWWGDDPPFHTPVFVLTHHPREPLEMKGGTTFYFVTEGIEAALDRGRKAAAGKNISLGGGADVIQQYLRARLIDEMDIHVVPMLLGAGARLFEDTQGAEKSYECTRLVSSAAAAHYRYRRIN